MHMCISFTDIRTLFPPVARSGPHALLNDIPIVMQALSALLRPLLIILLTDDNPVHIDSVGILLPLINPQMYMIIVEPAHGLLNLPGLMGEIIDDHLGDVLLEVL